MSELAERFEVLVEAFARKIAALSIDAAEQKGRADRAEAEVDRLRREYEPGYNGREASVDARTPVLDLAVATHDADEYARLAGERKAEIDRLRAELAEERKRACELSTSVEDLIEQREVDAEAHAATKVQLGRAVAALRDVKRAVDYNQREVPSGAGASTGRIVDWQHIERVCDAILADADGMQAAEVWRVITENADARLRELAIRLVAAGPKACAVSASECHEITNAVVTICDAVAAVDARRGGGR
jgi:hypothetical protein